ncbi:Transposable element P transposase [Folsomia candida]|uniref:Transposable element P transposase n=1 Tax=Folsomia candida TaxID=158441 RepID=A0A226CY01_FOLCA|nr:Transposable element P transposase [Folsomia candida]
MGRNCAIKHCPNRKGKPSQKVHLFPSAKHAVLRTIWISSTIGTASSLKLDNFGVCSRHFSSNDYVGHVTGLKTTGGAPVLRPTAIPTLNLCENPIDGAVLPGMEWTGIDMNAPLCIEVDRVEVNCAQIQQSVEDIAINDNDLNRSSNNELQLQLQIAQLKSEVQDCKTVLESKNRTIRSLRGQIQRITTELADEKEKMGKMLRKFFTEGQIRMLHNDFNTFIHWSEIDISRALTLYSISSKSYSYIREKCNYPFPSVSTLKRWLREVSIVPGKIMTPVMDVMRAKFLDKSERDRVCVLALDEVGINKRYVYDKSADKVYGERDCVPVITARSLFSSWKQVLYYDLENKTKGQHITEAIKSLFDIGLIVVAFVSDLGTKNQGLWKEFGIGKIKLLRNHLLDNGIKLPNGPILDRKLLEKLLTVQNSEFRLTLRYINSRASGLNPAVIGCLSAILFGMVHTSCDFPLGAKLFTFSMKLASCTCPYVIRFLTYGHVHEANFIENVNNFADLMNTRIVQENPNHYKCPYGMRKDRQDQLLNCIAKLFTNLRVGNRRTYAPFQKGWLINIRSLQDVFDDMKDRYGIKYILTSRLNQDYLENIFSQIRGLNGFKLNPDALEFMYRMKTLICNWNLTAPATGSVLVDAEDAAMVTSEVLKSLMSSQREEEMSTGPVISELQLDQFNELGDREFGSQNGGHNLSTAGRNQRSPFWVDFLSNGNLIEPSTMWYSTVKKFEDIFTILHPNMKIDMKPKVVRRIRHLNLKHEDESYVNGERKRLAFINNARGRDNDEKFEVPPDPAEADLEMINYILNSYV